MLAGPTVNPADPTSPLTGVIDVAAGNTHSCAVLSVGSVVCWGSNAYSQLGNGTRFDSSVPVAVSVVSGATRVVAGSGYSCALTSGGSVYCWGNIFSPTTPAQIKIFLPIVARGG